MTAEEAARYVGFKNATRRNRQVLPSQAYVAGGQIMKIDLPPTGVLSKVVIWCEITLTTSGGGTFVAKAGEDVTPFNAVKRVRVITNGGAAIYDTSGWGNYLWGRTLRESADVRNPMTTFDSTATSNLVYNLPGAFAISTSYTGATAIRFPIVIPIAQKESLQSGLILLQNKSTVISVELTIADLATELLTLGGGGTVTINTARFIPVVEFFNLPADPINNPDTNLVHRIIEQINPITGTGDFRYDVPVGNVYTAVMQEFINNNARMNPRTDLDNISLTYAVSQTPELVPVEHKLIQQFFELGNHLPDGVLFHSFDNGLGLRAIADPRDYVDTGAQTSVQLITQIASSVVLTNGKCRTIREELVQAV